jgi:hypothetical protein
VGLGVSERGVSAQREEGGHGHVNSNLVQYLLQTDIQKRTEKIQWKIKTLHRDISPGNPNRENQHILY